MHAIVTGASSGIGREIARAFHVRGAKLTLVARRQDLLESLARELGKDCHTVVRDLSANPTDTGWVADAEAVHGPIDVLVNNAGAQVIGPAAGIDPDEARRLLDLNLTAPLLLTRAVLPGMLSRGKGAIVDVASMAGVAPAPGMSWYGASKAGLIAFSEALHSELAGSGVHVVTVFPGPVETAMAAEARAVLAEVGGKVSNVPHGDPATLAQRIVEAVEQKRGRVIYPWFHRVRFIPWFGRWMTARAAPKIDPRPRRPSISPATAQTKQ